METLQETQAPETQALKPSQWAIYIFLSSLPLIGIILLLLWAFGSDGNIHRKSWAKGMLIIFLVVIILSIFFMLIFGLSFLTMTSYGD